jgi:hypothetical protein
MKLLPLVLVLMPLAACNIDASTNSTSSHPLSSRKGDACKVQLRRDALGAKAALPIPPTTDVFNGAEVSVSGELRKISNSGVLLEAAGEDIWIPSDSILLLQFPKDGLSFPSDTRTLEPIL